MAAAALEQITHHGTSIWLDDLSRSRLLLSDEKSLLHLTRTANVVGVTTNPAIFANALKDASTYQEAIAALRGRSATEAIRQITTEDVRTACDQLRDIFDRSAGVDGRVSIEVDPRLAHEQGATVAQAHELWNEVDRKNLFIKVPATKAGLPAITEVTRAGISVNVTLIFSLERYREVLLAYLLGLEERLAEGKTLEGIQSVASFFVSRVDSAIDPLLDGIADPRARALRGKAAVANARLAYRIFEEVSATSRWQQIANAGGAAQRPLWASTGVKDPAFPADMYVMGLVVDGCVNTMPEATLRASADSTNFRGDTVTGTQDASKAVWASLEALGISETEVCLHLEDEGVAKFEQSWTELLDTVTRALEAARA